MNVADIALADQFQAAEDDLERILKASAPSIGMTEEAEPGPWLAARLDHFADDALADRVTTCEHLHPGNGPRPAFGMLHGGPGLIVCQDCMHRLTPPRPLTCDQCTAATDEFHLATVQMGTVALLILRCTPCAESDDSEPAPTQ